MTPSRENRILFVLRRHGLPRLHTLLYKDTLDLPRRLVEMAGSGSLGKPEVCCVVDENHWRVIGTEAIAGCTEGREVAVAIDEIREVRLAPKYGDPTAPGIKQEMGKHSPRLLLEVLDTSGNRQEFCFGDLIEHSAFHNTLRRLTRKAPRASQSPSVRS